VVLLLALLGGFLLWGCDDSSAGNSVETENTASARKLPVDSILPLWNRPAGVTVATLRFDARNFDFRTSSSDGHDLRFERSDGTLIPFAVGVWDSAASQGRVLVRLDSSLRRPHSAIRMSWGLRSRTSLSDPAAVWAGVSDSVALLTNSVLVDDFEDGDWASLLPNSAWWQVSAADTAASLKSCVVVSADVGKAVHITYRANQPHYIVFSVALSNGPRNLRSFDSLVLRARGDGKLFMALEHLTNGSGPKAWTSRTLNTGWDSIRIRPSDFDPIDVASKNLGWNAVRDSVTHLTFILADGTEAWLDDIRLYGVNQDDLR